MTTRKAPVAASRNARAALTYADRLGWPVAPCRGKEPLIEGGFLSATTSTAQIVQWWARWPNANILIACDARSGLLTVDVDPRNGGDADLDQLEAEHGQLPHTVTGLTGGGGQHYLFKRPEGVSFHGKLAGGIDIKHNGYIIVPPSIHPDTKRAYAWDAASHPLDTPIAELPAWVLTRILKHDCGDFGHPADDAARSFLARAFAHAGWLGSRIDATRINCRCPWEDQHTQRSGSGGTIIFAPRQGSGAGWFHCSHSSHGPKTLQDVIAALPYSAVLAANADACEQVAVEYDHDTAERLAIQEDG